MESCLKVDKESQTNPINTIRLQVSQLSSIIICCSNSNNMYTFERPGRIIQPLFHLNNALPYIYMHVYFASWPMINDYGKQA